MEVGYEIKLPLDVKIPTKLIERFDVLETPVMLTIEVPVIRESNPNGSNEKVLAVLCNDLKVNIRTESLDQNATGVLRFEQKMLSLNRNDTADTLPMSPDFFENGGTPPASPPTSPSIL